MTMETMTITRNTDLIKSIGGYVWHVDCNKGAEMNVKLVFEFNKEILN